MKSAKTWEVKQRKKGPVSKGLPHHLHHNKIKQMRMPDGTKKKVKQVQKTKTKEGYWKYVPFIYSHFVSFSSLFIC